MSECLATGFDSSSRPPERALVVQFPRRADEGLRA